MTEREYQVVGEISLRAGPSLSTPVFQTRTSNSLWLQSIGGAERIESFLPVIEDGSSRVGYLNERATRRVGEQALYVFRNSKNAVRVDTREALVPDLRADYDSLQSYPYFSRSVARFLNDPALLERANRLIDSRRVRIRFSPDVSASDHYLRRDIDETIRRAAMEGRSVLLSGARGSGKTFMLRMLQDWLREQGISALYIRADVPESIPQAVFKALEGITRDSAKWPKAELADLRSGFFLDRGQIADLIALLKTVDISTLIFDDVDVVLSQNDAPIRTLVELVDAGVQVIAAAGDHSVQWLYAAAPRVERRFTHIVMTPPTSSELVEMLKKQLPQEFLDDISLYELASLVSGLNFRQIFTLLASLSMEARGNATFDLRDALNAALDNYVRRVLWESAETLNLGGEDVVAELLDAAARAEPGQSTVSSVTGFDPTLSRLMRDGILVLDADGGPRFAHRSIEEWWVRQRASRGGKLRI